MLNDGPIHLGQSCVEFPVTVFQDHLDGMCALIQFCEGLAKGGNGDVPGAFELIMHYRLLRSAFNKLPR